MTGEAFLPGASVAFDDLIVTSKFVSSSFLICRAPAHAEGSVMMSVANNGVDPGTSGAEFVYSQGPSVIKLVPSARGLGSASMLTVFGAYFRETEGL